MANKVTMPVHENNSGGFEKKYIQVAIEFVERHRKHRTHATLQGILILNTPYFVSEVKKESREADQANQ